MSLNVPTRAKSVAWHSSIVTVKVAVRGKNRGSSKVKVRVNVWTPTSLGSVLATVMVSPDKVRKGSTGVKLRVY